MCTVSFYNTGNQIIITSNRDEKTIRQQSTIPINTIDENGITKYFSQDVKALGTWFVTDSKGRVAVLLNGAFEKHQSKIGYEKSRGIVLLDIFSASDFEHAFTDYNLNNIEPFQILFYGNNILKRFIWDGITKHIIALNNDEYYIFSSATLYDKEAIANREKWFDDLVGSTQKLSSTAILDFHLNKNKEDKINGLTINRNNETQTFSVSQVVIENHQSIYSYLDLLTGNIVTEVINILQNEHESVS
jgi:uncharacterized protein with NRDE domain